MTTPKMAQNIVDNPCEHQAAYISTSQYLDGGGNTTFKASSGRFISEIKMKDLIINTFNNVLDVTRHGTPTHIK